MIKIQEHLNRLDAEEFLNALAERHWVQLNPKRIRDNEFKVASLIKKINKYLSKVDGDDYRNNYANGLNETVTRHKAFFEYLVANDNANAKRLIVSKPSDLEVIRLEVMQILNEEDLYTGTINNPTQTAFGKLLSEKIFDYGKYRGSEECIQTIEDLGLQNAACPYCNNQTIKIIELGKLEDKKLALLDIDHFMPKSISPFFAVSFFNLIPSCIICNGRIKKSKPFIPSTHINPYEESFNDHYQFVFDDKYTSLGGDFTPSLVLKKKGDKTAKDLELETRYENVYLKAKEIIDLYCKYRILYKDTPERLFDMIKGYGLVKKQNEIMKTERGKLMRDLVKQIDVCNILED